MGADYTTAPAHKLRAAGYTGLSYDEGLSQTPWSIWVNGEIVYFARTKGQAEDIFRRQRKLEVMRHRHKTTTE